MKLRSTYTTRFGSAGSSSLALGVLSGLLMGLSFRNSSAALVVLACAVPLLVAALRGVAHGLVAGFAAGIVGYAIVFAWLPDPLTRFQGIPANWAWTIFGIGVAFHALQFAAFGAAAGMIGSWWRSSVADARTGLQRRAIIVLVGVAASWTAIEWIYPKVFPWSLGAALTPHELFRQAADLGGVYGLGFAVMLVNGAIALAIATPAPRRVRYGLLFGAAGLLLSLGTYGYARSSAWRQLASVDEQASVVVGLVQGAIPVDHADRESAAQRGWATYEELTRNLLADSVDTPPSVIIWPETTLPVQLRTDPWYRSAVEQMVTETRRPLIVGALDQPNDGSGELNSAYAVLPTTARREQPQERQRWQIYHKSDLVPFAEYVPGGSWLPFVRTWRTTGELIAGSGREMFTIASGGAGTPPLRIAPSICVEGLQAGRFNSLVRAGADVLLNLTDDGWLAGSAGPELHLQLARLRAVETRRWFLRASNSGVTAVIDPTGEIVARVPFGQAGTLAARVVPLHQITPYVRFGDWIVWVSLFIVIMLGVSALARALAAARPISIGEPESARALDPTAARD